MQNTFKQHNDSVHSNTSSTQLGVQLSRRRNNTSVRTKRSNKRRRNKRNARNASGIITELPDINNKPIQTRCIRYSGTTTSELQMDSQDLRCFCGATTSASTAYYPIAQSVLLKRVGITIMSDSSTTTGSVNFSWNGLNAPDVLHTLLVGPGFPNHRSFYPQEGTSAWLWWDATSTTTELFGISATDSSITIFLDIEFEYVIADGAITNVALTTTASVTGLVYRQLPIGNPIFVPIGLSTDT